MVGGIDAGVDLWVIGPQRSLVTRKRQLLPVVRERCRSPRRWPATRNGSGSSGGRSQSREKELLQASKRVYSGFDAWSISGETSPATGVLGAGNNRSASRNRRTSSAVKAWPSWFG
jgi:hypothetical protein